MMGRMFRFGLCLLPVLLAGGAWAESAVADPTRPPSAAASASMAVAGQAAEGDLVLQSVFRPRKGKASAIINGQRVALGESLGDAKLVRILETEVILRGPGGNQHLSLTPAVSMKPVKSRVSPRAGKKNPKGGEKP
jgi:MSHA biogenesis protein MshK